MTRTMQWRGRRGCMCIVLFCIGLMGEARPTVRRPRLLVVVVACLFLFLVAHGGLPPAQNSSFCYPLSFRKRAARSAGRARQTWGGRRVPPPRSAAAGAPTEQRSAAGPAPPPTGCPLPLAGGRHRAGFWRVARATTVAGRAAVGRRSGGGVAGGLAHSAAGRWHAIMQWRSDVVYRLV